jgi:hypothetical protein
VDSHTSAVRRQLYFDEDNESPEAPVVFVAWCGLLVSWWMRLERRGSGISICRIVIGRYSAAFEHVQQRGSRAELGLNGKVGDRETHVRQ